MILINSNSFPAWSGVEQSSTFAYDFITCFSVGLYQFSNQRFMFYVLEYNFLLNSWERKVRARVSWKSETEHKVFSCLQAGLTELISTY